MTTTEPLAGRVALVTGAARGQGRSHCEALAEAGCDVIALDACADIPAAPYPMPTEADLAETARRVGGYGRRCMTTRVDVRDLPAMREAVTSGVGELGGLDFVVTSAGISPPIVASWERDESEWDETMGVNLKGTWVTTTAAIPHLLETGRGGAIVVISSMVGLVGAPYATSYVTSKWAVRGFAKSLAGELGPMDVRVNSIHPGNVRTPMIDNETMIRAMSGGQGTTLEDAAAGFESMNRLPRPWVEPEEISAMVVFLCGPAGRGITGAEIPVDLGGSSKFGA